MPRYNGIACLYENCRCVLNRALFPLLPECEGAFGVNIVDFSRFQFNDPPLPGEPSPDACYSRLSSEQIQGCGPCCHADENGNQLSVWHNNCTMPELCARVGGIHHAGWAGLGNAQGNPTCRPSDEYRVYSPYQDLVNGLDSCSRGLCCYDAPDCGCNPDVESLWYECQGGTRYEQTGGRTCQNTCKIACCRANGLCNDQSFTEDTCPCPSGTCKCSLANCSVGACCGTRADGRCVQLSACDCRNAGGTFKGGTCNLDGRGCDPCLQGCCHPDGHCTQELPEICVTRCVQVIEHPPGFGGPIVCATPSGQKCCHPDPCNEQACCFNCKEREATTPGREWACANITPQACNEVGGTSFPGRVCDGQDTPCPVTCCTEDFQGRSVCVVVEQKRCREIGFVSGCNEPCTENTCNKACCRFNPNTGQNDCFRTTPADCEKEGGVPTLFADCSPDPCSQACCIPTDPDSPFTESTCQVMGFFECHSLGGRPLPQRTCSPDPCDKGCCFGCGVCANVSTKECGELGGEPLPNPCELDVSCLHTVPDCYHGRGVVMISDAGFGVPITQFNERMNDLPLSDTCVKTRGNVQFNSSAIGHPVFCNIWDRHRTDRRRVSQCVVVIDQVTGIGKLRCPYRRECPELN